MRLFSRHAAFLLAFCFGKPSRVLAQPAQQITLDDVWNVAPGTTNGGCDNNRPILEQWNDESGELVLNAIRSLGDYSTNDVVRAAVQSFFKLQPKKGTTQPAKNNQFVALQSKVLLTCPSPDSFWSRSYHHLHERRTRTFVYTWHDVTMLLFPSHF